MQAAPRILPTHMHILLAVPEPQNRIPPSLADSLD